MVKYSILFIVLFNSFCFSQSRQIPSIDFSPKKYVCYKSEEGLNIDGRLNEKSWLNADWTDYFIDIEGLTKPLPVYNTRVKMLWDDNYFYIAAELEEQHIWATLKNRDDIIFYDNDFEVFIDPDGSTHSYVEFEMNALNTVWDLFLIQPYRDINKAALHGWDIKGLMSGVHIYGTLNNPEDKDSCWTVEIAFPWEAFKEVADVNIPPKDNDQWRINFSRVQWKTEIVNGKYQKLIDPATNKSYSEDNWVWSPQGVVNMHYPEMWGFVQFSEESVGNKKVSFKERNEEELKWFLRQIYYRQHIYFEKTGKFANDLKSLDIPTLTIPGYNMPPVIETTSIMFQASIIHEDGTYLYMINNNGWIGKINQ